MSMKMSDDGDDVDPNEFARTVFLGVEEAVLFNKEPVFGDLTPFAPRTDGGLVLIGCGAVFLGIVSIEGELLSIPGLVVGGIPAIVVLIGLFAVLYPPWMDGKD